MQSFAKVTKVEFEKFLSTYPIKLESHVAGQFEPPLLTYSDFSGGMSYPASVVAKHRIDTEDYYILGGKDG